MKKNNYKLFNFNLFVIMSTFGRNLVEIFIALILFKAGFSLKSIILFYTLIYAFCLMLSFPFIYIGKRYSHKIVTILSVISFGLLLIFLLNIKLTLEYLILVSFLYAVYRGGYWISRRYYNFRVIKKNDIGKHSTFITISDQVSKILAIFIGAVLLDKINVSLIFLLSGLLYLCSLLPLCELNFEHDKNGYELDIKNTFKAIGVGNSFLIGTYELNKMVQFLIPLYLYIYINNTFQIVGIMSVYTNLSVLIFTYLYGKTIDKSRSLLRISIFLTVLSFILKINVFGFALIVVSLMEGIVTKLYDVSINKEITQLSKKFEYNSYNFVYEILLVITRLIIGLILYIFVYDLKVMIYLVLLIMLIGIFIPFKQHKLDDFVWKNKN